MANKKKIATSAEKRWDRKYEKQTAEGEPIVIPNTVFYLFRESGTQNNGRYVTDQDGKIQVSLPAGRYYFEEVTPNIAYTFDMDGNNNPVKEYHLW